MTEEKKTESAKGFHIQGIWAVVVAVVTLVVGFLLRPAVDNIGYPKYADIGGVWKPHGDLFSYCEISTVKDSFYITIICEPRSGGAWALQGKGQLEKRSGSFVGFVSTEASNSDSNRLGVWGHAEMAGSDQIGITVFLDKQRTKLWRNFAFIRESSSSVEIPKEEKSR